jgi:hypothetical protein
MATVTVAPTFQRRVSLAQIDAIVSARLGPTRVPGNAQPACFNRQVAMYIARHVGRWSTSAIGHFYNGRDHSTVCHSIQRIEALRESDAEIDGLLADLKYQILENEPAEQEADDRDRPIRTSYSGARLDQLADLIAERVCIRLEKRFNKKLEQD